MTSPPAAGPVEQRPPAGRAQHHPGRELVGRGEHHRVQPGGGQLGRRAPPRRRPARRHASQPPVGHLVAGAARSRVLHRDRGGAAGAQRLRQQGQRLRHAADHDHVVRLGPHPAGTGQPADQLARAAAGCRPGRRSPDRPPAGRPSTARSARSQAVRGKADRSGTPGDRSRSMPAGGGSGSRSSPASGRRSVGPGRRAAPRWRPPCPRRSRADQALVEQPLVRVDDHARGRRRAPRRAPGWPAAGRRAPAGRRRSRRAARPPARPVSPLAGASLGPQLQEVRSGNWSTSSALGLVLRAGPYAGPAWSVMTRLPAPIAAGATGMVFVGGSVAVSGVLADAPLFTVQSLRYAVACLLLLGYARLARARLVRPRGAEWLWLLGVAAGRAGALQRRAGARRAARRTGGARVWRSPACRSCWP